MLVQRLRRWPNSKSALDKLEKWPPPHSVPFWAYSADCSHQSLPFYFSYMAVYGGPLAAGRDPGAVMVRHRHRHHIVATAQYVRYHAAA